MKVHPPIAIPASEILQERDSILQMLDPTFRLAPLGAWITVRHASAERSPVEVRPYAGIQYELTEQAKKDLADSERCRRARP